MTAADAYAFALLLALATTAEIARLERKVADLEGQRDAARQTVEQQQEEHAAWRLAHPVQPHRLIGGGRATPRDIPAGDLL